MYLKRRILLFYCFWFFISAPISTAESTLRFPCAPELSPILSVSEHRISKEIDLENYYRELADNFDTDIMPVESGSLVILDNQLMLLNIRYSEKFDYAANHTHLPEQLTLFNYEPDTCNDTGIPHWCITIYPDQDDPYSFHYVGTWNWSMSSFTLYGNYINPQGDLQQAFSFRVSIY